MPIVLKAPNLIVRVSTILYPCFRSKFDFRELSALPISCFLNELTFLSQNQYFLDKVQSSLEVQRVKGNFRTILTIIFLTFLVIQLRIESPQAKRYLISSITAQSCLTSCQMTYDSGSQKVRKYQKNDKCGWRHSLVLSPPSTN